MAQDGTGCYTPFWVSLLHHFNPFQHVVVVVERFRDVYNPALSGAAPTFYVPRALMKSYTTQYNQKKPGPSTAFSASTPVKAKTPRPLVMGTGQGVPGIEGKYLN